METEWQYYDEPWYNPLAGKVVIACRQTADIPTRTLNVEYLCQGEVRFVEINGEVVFGEE